MEAWTRQESAQGSWSGRRGRITTKKGKIVGIITKQDILRNKGKDPMPK